MWVLCVLCGVAGLFVVACAGCASLVLVALLSLMVDARIGPAPPSTVPPVVMMLVSPFVPK